MESIGQKLTTSRETLGLSIEQIARETNIAKSYLTALEQEDFDQFPGETYLIGFLRNYSEYLGLDPEEMVNLYRNMMIQEQPAPIEELLDKRSGAAKPAVILIAVAVVLALAAGFYFYIYPNFIQNRPLKEKPAAAEQTEDEAEGQRKVRNVYQFTDEVLEKSFSRNDAVNIRVNDKEYQLFIADIRDKAVFSHSLGEFEMSGGEEILTDLDGDSAADIRLILRSINSGAGTLVLHIDRFVQSTSDVKADGRAAGDTVPTSASSEESAAGSAVSGQAGAPSRVVAPVVIREGSKPESFTLNIIFRGYCMLRYETDQGIREERYFHKGETFRLDVNKEVRLWASNAGTLSSKVNGVDVTLGGSGEVSSRIIKWEFDNDDSVYKLKLLPLY